MMDSIKRAFVVVVIVFFETNRGRGASVVADTPRPLLSLTNSSREFIIATPPPPYPLIPQAFARSLS